MVLFPLLLLLRLILLVAAATGVHHCADCATPVCEGCREYQCAACDDDSFICDGCESFGHRDCLNSVTCSGCEVTNCDGCRDAALWAFCAGCHEFVCGGCQESGSGFICAACDDFFCDAGSASLCVRCGEMRCEGCVESGELCCAPVHDYTCGHCDDDTAMTAAVGAASVAASNAAAPE